MLLDVENVRDGRFWSLRYDVTVSCNYGVIAAFFSSKNTSITKQGT